MGQIPVKFFDANFKSATLREMNFNETFYGMDYDCHTSKGYRKIKYAMKYVKFPKFVTVDMNFFCVLH